MNLLCFLMAFRGCIIWLILIHIILLLVVNFYVVVILFSS